MTRRGTRQDGPATTEKSAQDWVAESLQSSEELSFRQLETETAKRAGHRYSKPAIYLALKNLTDQGHIELLGRGRRRAYHWLAASDASPALPPKPGRTTRLDLPTPPGVSSPSVLAQHLALGEIVIISIAGRSVLTASNQHGRLVLERHPLPPEP